MKQNKTKLSILTLVITAIVCFSVAILGLTATPSAKVSATEETATVSTSTIIVNASGATNAGVHILSKESVSETATKVYVEYTLGNDDGAGHSFMFDCSATTSAVTLKTGTSIWNGTMHGFANGHIARANNPALYTASYKITFDLTAKTVEWLRGTTVILTKTDVDYTDMVTFGFFSYTNNTSGYITAKIYDDTGKDLGVRSFDTSKMSIVAGEAEVNKITLINDAETSVVHVTDGTVFAQPTDPIKDGAGFFGWYTDEELTTKYDFNSEVTEDITLYAKFAEISSSTIIVNASGAANAGVQILSKESIAETATKVYVEYTLGNDDGAGHSFMFDCSATTSAVTLKTGTSIWNGTMHGFANGHIARANNPALYTASYKITFDLTAKTVEWLRGTTVILTKTDVDYTDMVTFGFFSYTNNTSGYITAKIYDDTGKDLGVRSFDTSKMSIVEGEVKVNKITLISDAENTSNVHVVDGTVYAEPTVIKDNHVFEGWYTDADFTTAYDFSQAVNSDITLYAKWVSVENVKSYTVTLLGEAVANTTKHFEASSRLPYSADATKIYIEYTLTDDNGSGGSFLFGQCAGTMVSAWRTNNLWNDKDSFAQANSHVWVANNAGLYAGSYKVIFDLVTNKMIWYRGTTVILEGTGTDFASAIQFGLYTGTAAGAGSMTVRIYDDMGKDLGVTSRNLNNITIDFPKATFDVNYDGGEDIIVDISKATVTAPENVTRNGYKLVGWYADADCTTEFDFTKELAGDTTIYAKWEEIPQVTVTFNTNGGTAVDPQTINIDTTATEPTTTKTGFVVEGWYTDADCTLKFNFDTTIGADMTLYAKWAVQTFTVSFYTNGGNTIDDATVEYGKKVVVPTAPTKPGYDFVGWFADEGLATEYNFDTEIYANTTIYAKWVEATYTVTFSTNGGSSIDSQTYNYGDTLAEPTAPTKTNYSFMGWYLDESLTRKANFPISVEGNMTIYAKWEVVVYTVTFDTDCDTVIEDVQVNSGATVAKPADPVKSGYTFEGWYAEVNGDEQFDFNTPITANITLYARWKAVPVNTEEGCQSSLGGNSIAIGGVMLAAAAVIAIKGFKKKED